MLQFMSTGDILSVQARPAVQPDGESQPSTRRSRRLAQPMVIASAIQAPKNLLVDSFQVGMQLNDLKCGPGIYCGR